MRKFRYYLDDLRTYVASFALVIFGAWFLGFMFMTLLEVHADLTLSNRFYVLIVPIFLVANLFGTVVAMYSWTETRKWHWFYFSFGAAQLLANAWPIMIWYTQPPDSVWMTSRFLSLHFGFVLTSLFLVLEWWLDSRELRERRSNLVGT